MPVLLQTHSTADVARCQSSSGTWLSTFKVDAPARSSLKRSRDSVGSTEWYFSIIDIVQALTNPLDYQKARKYWNKIAQRLREEGSEVVTNCHQLKMKAQDGKMRLTDVANTQTVLRIIQSIPSPKAEPFKLWLARVGYERIEETEDPELVLNMLAEASTTEISQKTKPIGLDKNKVVARQGGTVAKLARDEI